MKIILGVCSGMALLLCGCVHKGAVKTLDNWSKFENDLAGWYSAKYGTQGMRFEPSAIGYPIGSVLRKNSQSVLSAECVLDQTLPSPLEAPQLPTIVSSREIDATFDLNTYAAKLLGEGSKLNANLKVGPKLKVQMIEPVVVVLAENQTNLVLANPKCLEALAGKDVSIIRGYVEARYSISSSAGGSLGGQATVKSNDVAKLTLTANDSFTVEDAKPTKKFVILADAKIVSGTSPFNGFNFGLAQPVYCVPTVRLNTSSEAGRSDQECKDRKFSYPGTIIANDPNIPKPKEDSI